MSLSLTSLTVLGIVLVVFVLFVRGVNRRGRKTLLRALETLDEARRRQLLAKFTPKVQAELCGQLEERKKPNVT